MKCLKRMAWGLFLLFSVNVFAQPSPFAGIIAANGSTISSDLVNAATGALSQVQVFTGPFGLVASSPTGKFVYAAVGTTLYGATIDSGTGVLTPIPGFPYSTDTFPFNVSALLVEASGRFLYAATASQSSASFVGYRIDQGTGGLTPVGWFPFPLYGGTNALVSDPAGAYLYAAGIAVVRNTIDPTTGVLTVGGTAWFLPGPATGLAMDPQKRFLFVSGNGLSGYALNGTAGMGGLTPLAGSPFFAGNTAWAVSFDGSGNFLYASQGGSGLLWGFAVDPISGNLTAVPGSPFSCGAACYSVAGEASGKYLYAIDDNALLTYQINPATGTLTFINGVYLGGTSIAGKTSIALVPQVSSASSAQ